MLHVIALGDLARGFKFYGPFGDADQATKWADSLRITVEFGIYPLELAINIDPSLVKPIDEERAD